jgi:hypothetical protein
MVLAQTGKINDVNSVADGATTIVIMTFSMMTFSIMTMIIQLNDISIMT